MILYYFQAIFDGEPEDPNYNPLPEERPGGFDWGAGGENARANANDNDVNDRQDQAHQILMLQTVFKRELTKINVVCDSL